MRGLAEAVLPRREGRCPDLIKKRRDLARRRLPEGRRAFAHQKTALSLLKGKRGRGKETILSCLDKWGGPAVPLFPAR